jgi:ferritin-like metal-binding protein YciE
MNLDTNSFLHGIFGTRKALATVLYMYLDAEKTGEMPIFDMGSQLFKDPALLEMFEQHRADELKHIGMYEECLARLMVETGDLGDLSELLLVSEFHALSGSPFEALYKALTHGGEALGEAIMDAFLYLFALERRAVDSIQILLPIAHEAGDRDIAEMLEVILADEKVHLSYCNVIAKRFAPSIECFRVRKDELIALENDVYRRQTWKMIHHLNAHGLLKGYPTAGHTA